MDLKTFLENFETIAEAPNGIQKLRSLILNLALRGKLVPQNSDNTPVKISLNKAQVEKQNFLKKGKIKKEELYLPVELAEAFYKVPEDWLCVCLGEVVNCLDHLRKPVNKDERLSRKGNIPYYGANGQVGWIDNFLFDEPLVLVVEDETFIGRQLPFCYKVEGKSWVNNHAHVLQATSAIDIDFLNYSLAYYPFTELTSGTTGRRKLTKSTLLTVPFPLPPIEEQKQIVKKVNELMALCDRLQSAKQTRDNLRQKLRESAIDSLMNAETDEELEKGWAIVRDNWHDLSQDPKDVDDLRRSVLQLAARGKLVSQDLEDETAEQLLQKAIQEKDLIAQAGLIPKPRQSAPINEDEYPFSLPLSWKWVRLENICTYIVDCLHRTPKYQDQGYPAIRTSEMQPGKILFDQARRVGREEYEMQTQRLVPKAGDVFYSREGSFGIAAVVPEGIEMCLSQRMMQFRPVSEVNPHFFSWVMNSSVMYKQAARDVVGMTVPHVNIRSLREFVFPLAPYAEQKRIVVKVDELMQMCDRLEESLRQSQQRAEALAASAINHLTI